jgi:KDO2-lipid IV(A) lauroyltransferase
MLPRPVGLKIFGAIGSFVFLFPNREKQRTIEHLELIYGDKWDKSKIRKTAGQVYRELGRNLFDALYLSKVKSEEFNKIVRYESLEEFTEAYRMGKGVIVITAHVGCFEMLLHFFAIHGFRSFAIGRRLYDERLEKIIRGQRSGNNIEYMDRSESTMKIMRNLREGKAFGVLIDQDTNVEGVFADFLGLPAYTPSGPVKMSMKFGIPAFVSTTVRLSDNTHHVFIKRLSLVDTGNFDADLVTNVKIANSYICESIRSYPSQWVWMHRRWKRKP